MAENKSEGVTESYAAPVPVVDEPIETRRIIRQFDLRLLSLFTVINLFSFIDRVNIGNARLLGLQEDLDLSGVRFNIALTCLVVSYCVVELPSNILCKLIGGHVYIPVLVFCFGTVTMLMSLVTDRGGLYACRFILGIFEGGISPGLVFMLSLFYRRHELGFRTSIYISAASASGAFGGLLAIGLAKIPTWGLIHTWKNIFFFEGLVSIIIAIIAFFVIPSGPQTAKFLTPEERKIAVERIQLDAAGTDEHSRTTLRHIIQGLTNLPIVACALGFFFGNTCAQSFSVFSPTIIAAMGYTAELAQLLSVGPNVAACILSIIIGYISDHYKTRGYLILLTAPLGIAGIAMLLFLPDSAPSAKYGALYLAAPGIYSFVPLWLTWAVNNAATPTVKAVASGMVFSVGSLGGILAPWVYLSSDAPGYKTGHAILFAFLFASLGAAALLIAWVKRENMIRERGGRDDILIGLSEEQVGELSSRHPGFRYVI
ncbi:major facilitator superfamily domain-containing protein [Aspergillus venezuelensis]